MPVLGFRPLCLGKTEEGSWVLSSESSLHGLDVVGAEFVRDILPGEMVIIDDEGVHSYPFLLRKRRPPVYSIISILPARIR